jgi:hypothetical protein
LSQCDRWDRLLLRAAVRDLGGRPSPRAVARTRRSLLHSSCRSRLDTRQGSGSWIRPPRNSLLRPAPGSLDCAGRRDPHASTPRPRASGPLRILGSVAADTQGPSVTLAPSRRRVAEGQAGRGVDGCFVRLTMQGHLEVLRDMAFALAEEGAGPPIRLGPPGAACGAAGARDRRRLVGVRRSGPPREPAARRGQRAVAPPRAQCRRHLSPATAPLSVEATSRQRRGRGATFRAAVEADRPPGQGHGVGAPARRRGRPGPL